MHNHNGLIDRMGVKMMEPDGQMFQMCPGFVIHSYFNGAAMSSKT